MPQINPHDPLSYPIGFDIAASAEPLTFPEPTTVEELLTRLRQWLTAPRWRQGGWMKGAKNDKTPECGCLLGALVICRLGGKNPQQNGDFFLGILEKDILCEQAVLLLYSGMKEPKWFDRIKCLIDWQDRPYRAYTEVLNLIDRALASARDEELILRLSKRARREGTI